MSVRLVQPKQHKLTVKDLKTGDMFVFKDELESTTLPTIYMKLAASASGSESTIAVVVSGGGDSRPPGCYFTYNHANAAEVTLVDPVEFSLRSK